MEQLGEPDIDQKTDWKMNESNLSIFFFTPPQGLASLD
jgi:hypothetical protein